jgi:hypothetical protein
MIRLNTYRTYKRTLDDLIRWGFIRLVEKSHNQYSCNRITLIIHGEKGENAFALESEAKSEAKSIAEINTEKSGMDSKSKAEQVYTNYTKRKTNKHIKKEFKPPTLEEVKKYFDENGYSPEVAITAYMHYYLAGWHDSKGNPVLNWKQKMHTVWFKTENKKKERMLA